MSDSLNSDIISVTPVQHRCKSCGGQIRYNGQKQKLICRSCGSESDLDLSNIPIIETPYDGSDIPVPAWGEKKVSARCSQCGGNVDFDYLMAADLCPYCQSSMILYEPKDKQTPDAVIPFHVEEDRAGELIRKWINSKWFAPNKLKKFVRLNDPKGLFVPYWTFDANAYTDYTAEVGKDYTVQVPRTVTRDGKQVTEMVTETRTRWFTVSGDYSMSFDNMPVYASKRIPESFFSGVKFDSNNVIPFLSELLSSRIAEKCSTSLHEGYEGAKQKFANALESEISSSLLRRATIDHVRSVHINPTYSNVKYKRIIAPLWTMEYDYLGKKFNATINAQTGVVTGKYPISPVKVTLVVVGVIAVVGLLVYLFREYF